MAAATTALARVRAGVRALRAGRRAGVLCGRAVALLNHLSKYGIMSIQIWQCSRTSPNMALYRDKYGHRRFPNMDIASPNMAVQLHHPKYGHCVLTNRGIDSFQISVRKMGIVSFQIWQYSCNIPNMGIISFQTHTLTHTQFVRYTTTHTHTHTVPTHTQPHTHSVTLSHTHCLPATNTHTYTHTHSPTHPPTQFATTTA